MVNIFSQSYLKQDRQACLVMSLLAPMLKSHALSLRSSINFEIKFVDNYFFLENYVTSKGANSHNIYTINSSPLLVTK